MESADFEQRAALTLWPQGLHVGAMPAREFSTVREAVEAAAEAMEGGDGTPWIVTEDGSILRPTWIREQAQALRRRAS